MANPNPIPPPPHPENLRPPWKPGETGNPRGYSDGRRVTDALLELMAEKNAAKGIAAGWLAKTTGDTRALAGRNPDFRYLKELLERTEGKVPDRLEVKGGGVTKIVWTDDRNADDPDAAAAPGAAGGEAAPGAVQSSGMRPAMGQDEAGGGDVP